MAKEWMTSKERWLAVLSRQEPDRVPLDYRATPEATVRLMAHLGVATFADLASALHLDLPVSVQPSYIGPALAPNQDMYGCTFADIDYGTGSYQECVGHPLEDYQSVEEIEDNYTWPSADWFDYSVLPQQVAGKETSPVVGGGSEPFMIYCNLRGVQRGFLDLVDKPEMVEYCLGKLYDFCYEYTRRIYETIPGKVNITYVAEDMGSQEDLLFSPHHIRRFFFPHMRRMIELVHQAGAYAFLHSDGAVRRLIPELIELGYDALDPVQWRCKGMDREGLKADFGSRLVFHAGVDNQHTLAFGSVRDVEQEVCDNLRILNQGGGYILGPCHNIQPVSPPENIVAMYRAALEYA